MRFHSLIVLDSIILSASFDACASDFIKAWDDGGTPSSRLLRVSHEAVNNDEERAGPLNIEPESAISDLEQLAGALNTFKVKGPENAGTELFKPQQNSQWIQHLKKLKDVELVDKTKYEKELQRLVRLTNPQQVLAEIKCNSVKELLESPDLSFWSKFVDAYKAKNPEIYQDKLQWIVNRFGSKGLAIPLLEAKANKEVASIVEELEPQLLLRWQIDDFSIYDVYVELELDKISDDFSRSPLLDMWVSHMDYCVKNRRENLQDLIIKLEAHFKPRPFLQILDVAKKFPSLREIATDITICKHAGTPKNAFIQMGLAPEKPDLRSPHLEGHEAGVKQAGFDPTKENLLENPHFKNWLLYAGIYKKTFTQFQWFKVFGQFYSAKQIAQMIVQDAKNPDTSVMATNLWDKLTVYLLQKFRSPDLVFEYFEPLKEGEMGLITTKVKRWLDYRFKFNSRFPDPHKARVGMDKLDELIETLKLDAKNAKVVSKFEALSKETKDREIKAVFARAFATMEDAKKNSLNQEGKLDETKGPLLLNFEAPA